MVRLEDRIRWLAYVAKLGIQKAGADVFFTRLPQVASNQYILVAQPDGHDMICAVSRVGKTNDWNLWYKPKSFLKGLAVMSYN